MSELSKLPTEIGATSVELSYETISYHVERAHHLRNEELARIVAAAIAAPRKLIERLLHRTQRNSGKVALS